MATEEERAAYINLPESARKALRELCGMPVCGFPECKCANLTFKLNRKLLDE